MYCILEIKNNLSKGFSDLSLYLKTIDKDCVDILYHGNDTHKSINEFLKYIEPGWSPGWYSQRENVTENLNHSGYDYRKMIQPNTNEYVIFDSKKVEVPTSIIRDIKLNQILD